MYNLTVKQPTFPTQVLQSGINFPTVILFIAKCHPLRKKRPENTLCVTKNCIHIDPQNMMQHCYKCKITTIKHCLLNVQTERYKKYLPQNSPLEWVFIFFLLITKAIVTKEMLEETTWKVIEKAWKNRIFDIRNASNNSIKKTPWP
jgi:hypothetical protein